MNRHLPPLICLSYMSSSTLKLCRQPLCGGGILERCYEMRKSSRVGSEPKKKRRSRRRRVTTVPRSCGSGLMPVGLALHVFVAGDIVWKPRYARAYR